MIVETATTQGQALVADRSCLWGAIPPHRPSRLKTTIDQKTEEVVRRVPVLPLGVKFVLHVFFAVADRLRAFDIKTYLPTLLVLLLLLLLPPLLLLCRLQVSIVHVNELSGICFCYIGIKVVFVTDERLNISFTTMNS